TWGIGAFKSAGWEPGTDFGAVIFPAVPEPYLLFHPDGYGLAVGAPHPESTLNWLRVVASPELQIPTDVIQGGLFARTDIDPAEFPDPIRQEMQQFVADNPGNLILDQHGSIAPASFSNEYWIVIARFMADENATVEDTAAQVQALFETYDVASEAAWYQWPESCHGIRCADRTLGRGAGTVRHPALHSISRPLKGRHAPPVNFKRV